jgi:DNA polymerase III delta prime subunit
MALEQSLWVEKYRPRVIEDCVLPDRLKLFFQSQVNRGELQNLLLIGGAGCGKTTAAKAMCNEMGIDMLFVNASENGNIDTLRTLVRSFASTISFADGKRKCVILDEADYLNPNSTQPALRGFLEEFSNNCRFILTANFGNRILDPIKSRCTVVDFTLTKDEKQECVMAFNRRVKNILEVEGVSFDKKDLAQIVVKYFPDYRKILNELQRSCHSETLVLSGLATVGDEAIKQLVKHLKEKKFGDMRKWVAQNMDMEFSQIVRGLFDKMVELAQGQSIPDMVLTLNEYDYRKSFVADQEINTVAMLTQLMGTVEWK